MIKFGRKEIHMASAKDRHRMLRIIEATKDLGLWDKKIFTIGELEAIARKSECSLHEVMKYLRNR